MAFRQALLFTLPLCLLSARAPADEPQDRARALYDGRPAAAAITARTGPGNLAVPASRLPCRNCHGRDGRGGSEAGTAVPPIFPAALARPSLKRSSYDPALFADAVRNGRASGGRTLDTAMPRYALDDAAMAELWAFLTGREAQEKSGVEAGSVRFGVAPRAGLDLPELMQAAWRERGEPTIHGRRIRFEPIGRDGRDDVLATLFDQEATSSAAPRLFPFAAWSGEDRGDEVRGFFADRSRQAEALRERMPPGTRRISENGQAFGPAGAREPWENLADVVTLDGPALVLAGPDGWSRLCRRIGRGVHLFAPLHDVEAALPCLRVAGATVTVADPSFHASEDPQNPFAVRLVRTAAAILDDALVQAGRDLTRGGLMRAVGTIRRADLPWPELDFTRYPLSGSRAVRIETIGRSP